MSGSDSRDFESAIDAFSKESAISFDVYPPSDKLYEKYRSRYDNIQVFKLEHDNVGYEKIAKATADCKFFIVMLLFSFLQGFAQFYLNILSENY